MPNKPRSLLTLTIITAVILTACSTLLEVVPTPTTPPPAPTNTTVPEPTEEEPPPTAEGILFQDDFSQAESGWDRFDNVDGITDYVDGSFLIGIYTNERLFWANPNQSFQDVIIEVDTEMISTEEDNQYGIICRHQDTENWYALVISADGYAAFRKRSQGELNSYVEWVESEAINTGMSANHLRAECIGNRLTLYVNGVLTIETFDSDITAGDVGLMAGTISADQTEILFDNFVVVSP